MERVPHGRLLVCVAALMVALPVAFAACGTAGSTTTSSATDQPTKQSAAPSSSSSTLLDFENLEEQPATAQTVPALDGWSITLIPGTDKMIAELEQVNDTGQSNMTTVGPGPLMFDPSVAVDGDRVVYSALYDKATQVYLYDIPSGEVTQLTDDAPAKYLEQLQVQVSGDWVAWMRGYPTNAIHLRNLVTGETKQFTPHPTVVSWRLVGNQLAWEEMEQLHEAELYLYDPAVGSVQTIDAAHGLLSFDMDDKHIAWGGGSGWNEYYLYNLANGETEKVAQDSQQSGEFVVVKGDILAWTARTGDRTTLVVHRLDTGEEKVVDEFGPFNPELQSDGRYVAWNRGEEATGTAVWVYDTETGETIDLGGTWPSIDDGRVAWLGFFPGRGREVVMVRDLAGGLTTHLTNSRWGDQPPSISGGQIVWARRNSDPSSSEGRGIFVATAPADPPAAAFADLAPDAEYRSAIEWLGEKGYDSGYPGSGGPEFRPEEQLRLTDFCALLARVLPIDVGDEAQASTAFAQQGILDEAERNLAADVPLTRAQAVSLLVRALDHAYPGVLSALPGGGGAERRFDDPVYGEDLTRAAWNLLLDGLAGYSFSGWEWDYSAPATRSEAAQLLWNAYGVYLQP
jgi:hypothetical protein